MVREIKWTKESVESFESIIQYLEENWSENEIERFVKISTRVIQFIAEQPMMFRKTNRKNVREAVVLPQVLLIYKVSKTHIDLISFWDTRQHPVTKPSK